MQTRDDDIRLIYIGSAHRAVHYATDHLPEPAPRADQVLAIREPADVQHLQLPPWCHIAIELHTTADRGTYAALEGYEVVFEAALSRRRKLPPKAGV